MLRVHLLGTGQATFLDRPLVGFSNQQAWLLLCYLLLNKRHPQNRERLAAVFWADQPAHIARKNFRNALWRLRQVLAITGMRPEEYLHINDEGVTFLQYAPCWLDVDVFEAAGRWANLSPTDLQPAQVAEMETAVDLYHGDLLENIYEDWCIYDRERLRMLNLNMLNKLMVYYGTGGNYEPGLRFGERILCFDNTREDIHRQMMWMYWCSGNQSAALAQYKLCTQILRDELNVPPTESTRQLYEQVLHHPAPQLNWSEIPVRSSHAADENNGTVIDKNSLLPLTENALEQIRRLERVLEETRAELLQMERLINQVLMNNRQV